MQATQGTYSNVIEPTLYMVFELGDKTWKLGFSDGGKERIKQVKALDTCKVLEEISLAKKKFGLEQDCKVISCYEAGWEGFWLARWLESVGITNHVIDSSAIEINRRAKRAKTDKIDTRKLLNLLVRYCAGETQAIRIVRVPDSEPEDDRQANRERKELVKDRGRHWVRIKSLLRAQGLRMETKTDFLKQLDELRLWNAEALPVQLKERLQREWERHEAVHRQIQHLEAQQKRLVEEAGKETYRLVAQLMMLKSVGYQSAYTLVMEFFGWRQFRNRRELASLAGLTPMPYDSGESSREQGISKAGNRRIRTLMIELSWLWVRFQPHSALTLWFMKRFGHGSKRQRRIGIVALARKLLVGLWRYLETGAIPEGAILT